MLEKIIAPLANFVIFTISKLGYAGIVLTMGIESATIPLPSEIIMPFSGYLVSQGRFTLLGISLAGALGCLLGSILAYAVGFYGGEPVVRKLIRKYGKYFLIHEYELDEATHWFKKHGSLITFIARLLPVIRTFISLPAGIAKMNFPRFAFYAFTGSLIWSAFLGYIGFQLGEHWNTLGSYFHKFDALILALGIGSVIWYILHKKRKSTNTIKDKKTPNPETF